MKDLYHVSNAWETMVFDLDEDIYHGIDGNIYIGSCGQEVYGTSEAAEGYAEELVESVSDIRNYFKGYDTITRRTDQGDYKPVDKEEFLSKVITAYEDLVKETEKDL